MNSGNYYITKKGREMIAEMVAGGLDTLTISRTMIGSGKPQDGDDPREFTDLIAPIAQATTTEPLEDGDTVSFTVQYRNDMNGGLESAIVINEFGIFAWGSDNQEYLIFYGELGEFPEPVTAYKNGRIDVREYPVRLVIVDGVDVVIENPSDAYLTYEQMVEYVRVKMLSLFMAELAKLIKEHNEDPEAHPYLTAWQRQQDGRLQRLEDMFLSNIKDNSFAFTFATEADMAKVTWTGVWNEALGQIEW